MSSVFHRATFAFGIAISFHTPVLAQFTPQPAPNEMCQSPASIWNPMCANQRNDNRQRPQESFQEFQQVGPLGPIERVSLPRDADSVIALVPPRLQNTNAPPMWVRICRTNSNDGNGASNYMWLRADGEVIRLVYPRCVYVAFQTRVSIGTVGNDEATVEYQFLGRR